MVKEIVRQSRDRAVRRLPRREVRVKQPFQEWPVKGVET
jgi:hypothetical protein